jgi:hypothetical protein
MAIKVRISKTARALPTNNKLQNRQEWVNCANRVIPNSGFTAEIIETAHEIKFDSNYSKHCIFVVFTEMTTNITVLRSDDTTWQKFTEVQRNIQSVFGAVCSSKCARKLLLEYTVSSS